MEPDNIGSEIDALKGLQITLEISGLTVRNGESVVQAQTRVQRAPPGLQEKEPRVEDKIFVRGTPGIFPVARLPSPPLHYKKDV